MECYDDQVQSRYGFYRPVVSHVVQKYHGCGDLHQGFAKIKWPDYQHEYLLAFSCRGRWFCPSTDSLGEYVEKKNQRAHPADPPENTEPIEIVPYDDGWLGYDEPVFDF
jgi:hypothetical protein